MLANTSTDSHVGYRRLLSHRQAPLAEQGLADDVVAGVARLFELRHIFAHELASTVQVKVKDIILASRWAFMFLYATETMLEGLLSAQRSDSLRTGADGATE